MAWGEGRGGLGRGGIENCHRMSRNVRKRQKNLNNSKCQKCPKNVEK